jgi:starch phosphorylase
VEFAAWIEKVRGSWSEVEITHVESTGQADTPELGQWLDVTALIHLGGLAPDEVLVQVAYGRVDDEDEFDDPTCVEMTNGGEVEGQPSTWRFEGRVPLERRGSFGYTVRVLPRHPAFAADVELDLVAV